MHSTQKVEVTETDLAQLCKEAEIEQKVTAPDLTPKSPEEYIDFAYYISTKLLKKYRIPFTAWEDCHMEAMVGLMKAYNSYDKNNVQGAKFTTFASFRIMGQVIDYLKKLNYLKYSPKNSEDAVNGYGASIMLNSLSFFNETAQSDEMSVGIDLYNSVTNPDSVYDTSMDVLEKEMLVTELLDKAPLSEKEKGLIVRRYFKEHSLAEIAKDWGCSTVNVSLFNTKAIAKLNKYCREMDEKIYSKS